MGLLSIFKRADASSSAAASEPGDAVQRARTRARQRLIGAAVLVVIGIIGFPLVFETQPRPIPVDIPIELPRKEGAPALVMPAARAPMANAPAVPQAPVVAASGGAIEPTTREAARRDTSAAPIEPPIAAASAEPRPAAVVSDGARAKALLEGKPTPVASAAGRFIVQVGAFADAGAARDTRLKVEKLGLKTYTQVASTSSGDRIRVRVGPFATRDEADRAMAKAKGAGLSAVVLAL